MYGGAPFFRHDSQSSSQIIHGMPRRNHHLDAYIMAVDGELVITIAVVKRWLLEFLTFRRSLDGPSGAPSSIWNAAIFLYTCDPICLQTSRSQPFTNTEPKTRFLQNPGHTTGPYSTSQCSEILRLVLQPQWKEMDKSCQLSIWRVYRRPDRVLAEHFQVLKTKTASRAKTVIIITQRRWLVNSLE